MSEDYSIAWKHHGPETILALNRLRLQEALFDVVIYCRTEVFRAHKLILSVCSEYFEGVFTAHPLAESKDPVILMHQTQPHLFRMALEFMYTGEVEVPHGDLEPFMELAECLLIRGLRKYQHVAYDQPQSQTPLASDLSPHPGSGDGRIDGSPAPSHAQVGGVARDAALATSCSSSSAMDNNNGLIPAAHAVFAASALLPPHASSSSPSSSCGGAALPEDSLQSSPLPLVNNLHTPPINRHQQLHDVQRHPGQPQHNNHQQHPALSSTPPPSPPLSDDATNNVGGNIMMSSSSAMTSPVVGVLGVGLPGLSPPGPLSNRPSSLLSSSSALISSHVGNAGGGGSGWRPSEGIDYSMSGAAAAVAGAAITPPVSDADGAGMESGGGGGANGGGGSGQKSSSSSKSATRRRGSGGAAGQKGRKRTSNQGRAKRARRLVKSEASGDCTPLGGNLLRALEAGPIHQFEGDEMDENGEMRPSENEMPAEDSSSNSSLTAVAKSEAPPDVTGLEPISTLMYREASKGVGSGPMYVCAACGYRTVSRSYALTHERTHTGERPFPCRIGCGKFFTQTSSRNLHESKRRCLGEDRAPQIIGGEAVEAQ